MLKVIQGDTLRRIVTVEIGAELVEDLWFTCEHLGISQKLPKISDNEWLIVVEHEKTRNYKPCKTTYDITIYKKDNQVDTEIYNDELLVLVKDNPIHEY